MLQCVYVYVCMYTCYCVCVCVCLCVHTQATVCMCVCVCYSAVTELAGLVDIAQQLGDFDEVGHRSLGLLLQPLVILPEALHLSLQHRLVLLLLPGGGTQQHPSVRPPWLGGGGGWGGGQGGVGEWGRGGEGRGGGEGGGGGARGREGEEG